MPSVYTRACVPKCAGTHIASHHIAQLIDKSIDRCVVVLHHRTQLADGLIGCSAAAAVGGEDQTHTHTDRHFHALCGRAVSTALRFQLITAR